MSKEKFAAFYKKYGIFIILIFVIAFFSIFAQNFFSASNFITILRQVSMLGIVVMAMSLIMISGGMDLSVGGQIAVGGVLSALEMASAHLPTPVVILLSLGFGLLCGFINGWLSVSLNIAPMIVTLGTMLILQSLALVITGGYPIYDINEDIKVLGQGYIGFLPVPVLIFAVVVFVSWFLLKKTYLGHFTYAVGGNPEAARLSGINVAKFRIFIFMLGGFFTSIASLIVMARASSAQPNAGSNYAFDAITAAVLGGISIVGGEGTIEGSLIGVLIIGILNNGLLLMGIDSNWQGVIKGIVLIAAVGVDSIQHIDKKVKISSEEIKEANADDTKH